MGGVLAAFTALSSINLGPSGVTMISMWAGPHRHPKASRTLRAYLHCGVVRASLCSSNLRRGREGSRETAQKVDKRAPRAPASPHPAPAPLALLSFALHAAHFPPVVS
jgi:hypothetical protein